MYETPLELLILPLAPAATTKDNTEAKEESGQARPRPYIDTGEGAYNSEWLGGEDKILSAGEKHEKTQASSQRQSHHIKGQMEETSVCSFDQEPYPWQPHLWQLQLLVCLHEAY